MTRWSEKVCLGALWTVGFRRTRPASWRWAGTEASWGRGGEACWENGPSNREVGAGHMRGLGGHRGREASGAGPRCSHLGYGYGVPLGAGLHCRLSPGSLSGVQLPQCPRVSPQVWGLGAKAKPLLEQEVTRGPCAEGHGLCLLGLSTGRGTWITPGTKV